MKQVKLAVLKPVLINLDASIKNISVTDDKDEDVS